MLAVVRRCTLIAEGTMRRNLSVTLLFERVTWVSDSYLVIHKPELPFCLEKSSDYHTRSRKKRVSCFRFNCSKPGGVANFSSCEV